MDRRHKLANEAAHGMGSRKTLDQSMIVNVDNNYKATMVK